MADGPYENIIKSIKLLQQLRIDVCLLFGHLSIGPSDEYPDAESNFVNHIKENLASINQNLNDFDKLLNSLQIPISFFANGGIGLLSIDPLLEKSQIHKQLMHAYKWSSRTHDFSSIAINYLNQNHLRKSHSIQNSKNKSRKNVNIGFSLPMQTVDNYLTSIFRSFQGLSVTYNRPHAPLLNPTILVISIGTVARFYLSLRGMSVENIVARAFDEDVYYENKKVIDYCSSSKYSVFQTVTDHSKSALLNFYTINTDNGIRQLLAWIQSYRTLFTSPCLKCNRILLDFQPPTWRDFRLFEAYHPICVRS